MLPAIPYGCETWILNDEILNSFDTKYVGMIIGYHQSDSVSMQRLLCLTNMKLVTCQG